MGGKVTLGYDHLNGQPGKGSATGYRELTWGQTYAWWDICQKYPQPGSSLRLNNKSGVMHTNGADVNGISITHTNMPISSSYRTLNSGSMLLTLDLKPSGADSSDTYSITMSFDFFETPNNCFTDRDIFIVKDPYVSSEKFRIGDYEYEISFEAAFQPLTGWYLEYAQRELGLSRDTPLYGWTTAEKCCTNFATQLRIDSTYSPLTPAPTPEPGTILLMGAGLGGLVFLARRRKLRQ